MNLVKNEKGYSPSDYHCSFSTWKNIFCQILNNRWVNNVRQTAILTAEPSQPEPSFLWFEVPADGNNTQILSGI